MTASQSPLREVTVSAAPRSSSASESPEEGGSSFHVLSQLGGVQYSVRYTKDGPFALNMERIRYMFSLLPADR